MGSILKESLSTLKTGNILLYPTDTVWGIGCDATKVEAVQKIYDLKKRTAAKAMICLVSDTHMLETYIPYVPPAAYDIIESSIGSPTTIIYDHPADVAENLIGEDDTLAIRVVHSGFCHELVKRYGRPVVSTSANISGEPAPQGFSDISPAVLNGMDYVVNLPPTASPGRSKAKPSTIIRLRSDGQVHIIRE